MPKKEKGIELQFLNIKEKSFSNTLSDDILRDFDEKNLQFSIGFSATGNSEDDTVTISIRVKFRYLLFNDKPKEFFTFNTDSTFKIFDVQSNQDKIKIQKDDVYLDDELMGFFLNISVGATRGMIAYKLANLPINIALPIINVGDLMEAFKNNEVVKSKSRKKK